LTQICTKSFFGWAFALDPTGELTALAAPPEPLDGLAGGAPGEREGRRGRKGGGPGMPKFRVGKPTLVFLTYFQQQYLPPH